MMKGEGKRMGGMMNMKCPGMVEMHGKNTMMGVPRKKVSGKSGSISKADMRGKDDACVNR